MRSVFHTLVFLFLLLADQVSAQSTGRDRVVPVFRGDCAHNHICCDVGCPCCPESKRWLKYSGSTASTRKEISRTTEPIADTFDVHVKYDFAAIAVEAKKRTAYTEYFSDTRTGLQYRIDRDKTDKLVRKEIATQYPTDSLRFVEYYDANQKKIGSIRQGPVTAVTTIKGYAPAREMFIDVRNSIDVTDVPRDFITRDMVTNVPVITGSGDTARVLTTWTTYDQYIKADTTLYTYSTDGKLLRTDFSGVKAFRAGNAGWMGMLSLQPQAVLLLQGSDKRKYLYDSLFAKLSTVAYDTIGEDNQGYRIVGLRDRNDMKFGYVNSRGKIIAAPVYDEAYDFSGDRARVQRDKKYGYIDTAGNEVIPCEYKEAEDFRGQYAFVEKRKYKVLIDQRGEVAGLSESELQNSELTYSLSQLKPLRTADGQRYYPVEATKGMSFYEYQFVADIRKTLGLKPKAVAPKKAGTDRSIVYANGKYGVRDDAGNEIIPLKYEVVELIPGGLFKVCVTDMYDDKGDLDNPKWMVYGRDGQPVTKQEFDNCGGLDSVLVVVIEKGKVGLMDHNGKMVVPIRYDQLNPFAGNLLYVIENNKTRLVTRDHKSASPLEFQQLGACHNGMAIAKVNDKWGWIDSTGKVAIPFQYDKATDFRGDRAMVTEGTHSTIIDKRGDEVIPGNYDRLEQMRGKMYRAVKNGKSGIVNDGGTVLTPVQYEYVTNGDDGFPKLKDHDRWGFSNRSGEIMVAPTYDRLGDFWYSKGKPCLAYMQRNGLWGFIDTLGNETIPPQYEGFEVFRKSPNATYFENDCIWLKKNGKWGVVSAKNQQLLPFIYEERTAFKTDRTGLYHTYDSVLFYSVLTLVLRDSIEYDTLSFNCKIIGSRKVVNPNKGFKIVNERVNVNGREVSRYAWVNWYGQHICQPVYERIYAFRGSLSPVQRDKKWGFMDTTGREVISPIYDHYEYTRDSLIIVQKEGKWGLLSNDGRALTPIKYVNLASAEFSCDRMSVCPAISVAQEPNGTWKATGDKIGYIDKNGVEVIPPQYDYVWKFDAKTCRAVVRLNGLCGIIDASGKVLVPAKYNTPREALEQLK